MTITIHDSQDTIYSADSVEFNPHCPNQVAVGTYQVISNESNESLESTESLESIKCNRKGKLHLYSILNHQKIETLFSIETEAILDMKWLHKKPWLSWVTAQGQIQFLNQNANVTTHLSPNSILNLSLDWSLDDAFLLISQSNGSLELFQLEESDEIIPLHSFTNAHSYEAWTVCFDKFESNVFYSGGDDGLFKGWDTRTHVSTFKNTSHTAGVTCISSHPDKPYCLLTGSYDESLKLWDTRSMKSPLSQIELGGGIWRLKWHPYHTDVLAAACMYNGFHVLSCNQNTMNVLDSFEHGSISYGADWQWNQDSLILGTCSFYNHLFQIQEFCF